MKYIFAGLIITLSLISCTRQNIIVSGDVNTEIDPSMVKVYLMDRPPCDFNVVVDIQIPGDYFSRASIIDAFKKTAARYGAPILQVTSLDRLNTTEYLGTARGLRCIPYTIMK